MKKLPALIFSLLFIFTLGEGCGAGESRIDSGTSDSGPDGGASDGSSSDSGHDAGRDGGYSSEGWDLSNRWKTSQMPTCPSPSNPTKKTLRQKAEYYDWISDKIHLVSESVRPYSLPHDVTLKGDVPLEIVSDDKIPAVELYHWDENHGLWGSLFVASQAFRYAVTGDAGALKTLRRAFTGTYNQMKITGVEGLFTREYRDSSIPGDECPPDGPEYSKPVDRTGNRWVKLDAEACSWYWDPKAGGGSGAMVKDNPAHCVDRKYANMCWQRNCSKDESSGHNFAAAVIYLLVDDPELKGMASEILTGFANHLMDNGYRIVDYDGTPTKYGSYFALSLDEFPGFNANLALAATRSGLVAGGGDKKFRDAYYNCLLQLKGEFKCIAGEYNNPLDYREYMKDGVGLNLPCSIQNYDNVNMALLNYFILVMYEGNEKFRNQYRYYFHEGTRYANSIGQSLWTELNPHWNFLIAGLLDPTDKGTFGVTIDETAALKMINDGICTLKNFPEANIDNKTDTTKYLEACLSSRHGSLALGPIPVEERCQRQFIWWGDPYERQVCGGNPKVANRPGGYLLPYWAGRYFGFITENM
jgi:hypothetical protein